jgi:hypothetical protein
MDTRPEENDGRSKAVTTGGGWHGGIGRHDDVQSGVHARAEQEPVREGGRLCGFYAEGATGKRGPGGNRTREWQSRVMVGRRTSV